VYPQSASSRISRQQQRLTAASRQKREQDKERHAAFSYRESGVIP
jgi:hypothetical protein